MDANINRAVEGLRVLEETARMLFNDSILTIAIKDIRHSFSRLMEDNYNSGAKLLKARSVENDVLRFIETNSEKTPL